MTEFDDPLYQLVVEACKHPPGSVQRQRNLTQVIRRVSPKLWREYTPYYQDALQQTWVYFCQNVCEKGSGEKYDPTRSSVATWLNYYLRRRLQDHFIQHQKQQATQASGQARGAKSGEPGEFVDPIDLVPAPPDVPPILEEVKAWAEADATGELAATHIKGRPEVNCQVLILRRLPPETSWKALSEEFSLPIPTLSAFYQRQCVPRLRKFGESEGYV
jgi:hypothetical protein